MALLFIFIQNFMQIIQYILIVTTSINTLLTAKLVLENVEILTFSCSDMETIEIRNSSFQLQFFYWFLKGLY